MDKQKPPLYNGEEQYYMNRHKITPPPSHKTLQIVSAALAVVVVIAIVQGVLVFRLATTQTRNANFPFVRSGNTLSSNAEPSRSPSLSGGTISPYHRIYHKSI